MSRASLSNSFPNGHWVRAAASVMTAIICEHIPGLKGGDVDSDVAEHYRRYSAQIFGDNNSAASAFGSACLTRLHIDQIGNFDLSIAAINRLQEEIYLGLLEHIRFNGQNFRSVGLYLRDERETDPLWFKEIIEKLATEINFPLFTLLPDRFKIAFILHDDGEIFYGTSSYGPARASIRIPFYAGKPENTVPFVDIKQFNPDPDRFYAFKMGEYRRVLLPVGQNVGRSVTKYLAGQKNFLSNLAEGAENEWGQTITQENLNENAARYKRNIEICESLLAEWSALGMSGELGDCVAFVPIELYKTFSQEDLRNNDFLNTIPLLRGVVKCTAYSKVYYSTSSHNPAQRADIYPKASDHSVFFVPEGDKFGCYTEPFQLLRASAPLQFGVGRENLKVKCGNYIMKIAHYGNPFDDHNYKVLASSGWPDLLEVRVGATHQEVSVGQPVSAVDTFTPIFDPPSA